MEASTLCLETPPVQPGMVSIDVLALIADAAICTDEDGIVLFFNRAAEESFGYSATEVIGQHVEMLLPQRDRTQHAVSLRSFAAVKGNTGRLMGARREVRGLRKSGEEFPSEAVVSRHSLDGRTILSVVHRDITERKEMEQQREAIARELDHRISNMISVVSSLVSLSAGSAESVSQFALSLQERLRALARTQTFLRSGREGDVYLSDLLLAELAFYRSEDGANVVVEGEPVIVGTPALQPLALVFHELATNSAKYGAFSVPSGRVTVSAEWVTDADEQSLEVEWREVGGPLAKPPSQEGFGSTLIKQMITRALRARYSLDYLPGGLVCRLTLPKSQIEA